MISVNSLIAHLKPYKVASHKIWTVSAGEREAMLKLDWNESTAEPAPEVKAALQKLLDEGGFFHLYPSTYNEKLMEALSAYTGLPAENIQYFGSSDSLHEYLCRAYLEPEDKVLVLWPSYDNFRMTAESTGARLFYSEMSADFELRPEVLQSHLAAISPKLCYICNPNNPTGTLLPPEIVEALLADFPETVFLIDEAYEEFSSGSVRELVRKYDNLLVTRTLSKAFGLANLRFGYLLASAENIEAVSRIRNPKNITTFTQVAAAEALLHPETMQAYVAEVTAAREEFLKALGEKPFAGRLEAFPSRANFVLIRLESAELKEKLFAFLEKNDIFVRNVSQSRSLERCLRITIGTRPQMQRVISVMKLAFETELR